MCLDIRLSDNLVDRKLEQIKKSVCNFLTTGPPEKSPIMPEFWTKNLNAKKGLTKVTNT